MCKPEILSFLLLSVIFGFAMALVEKFLYLYLINTLNASPKLCGLTTTFTVILELPIFYFTENLLNLIGAHGMFALAAISYILRTYIYTILTEKSVVWILAVEPLHGITFGCFYSAAVIYTK